jgi:endoglucanase
VIGRQLRATLAALEAVVMVACSSTATRVPTPTSAPPPPPPSPSRPVVDSQLNGPLRTEGRLLVDAAGAPVILRGAQIQSYNVAGAYQTTTWLRPAAFAAMHSWGMNELRLPFSACLVSGDAGYLPRLVQIARQAESAGLYVVLALFEDARAGCPVGGISLPHPEVVGEWASVAAAFRSDPNVLFDLFNEPSLGTGPTTDAGWNIWAHGGSVASASGASVAVVGFDALAQTIRNAGAVTQPLVAEAINVDNLTGVTGHLLADTNVVYSIHTYFQGDLSPRYWDPMFGTEAASLPVFVGEWAFLPNGQYPSMCSDLHLTTTGATSLVNRFLTYMDARQVSYNTWSFTPTHLIVNEAGFAPTRMPNPMVCSPLLKTAGMGALYKAHLAKLVSG